MLALAELWGGQPAFAFSRGAGPAIPLPCSLLRQRLVSERRVMDATLLFKLWVKPPGGTDAS